ncbi:hypothetical protein OG302_03170 [Streptomyces sp. NBC_01283]|uniref:hypothetical protein n=1 Tax=Streptomyces sp. NBC_01283 TaxID=2903812 RepID=UPI00352E0186|nr:hypothetical protein OG302_03170 [Streptomyces sp. NBC_01283]
MERLDRAATELENAPESQGAEVRTRMDTVWRTRFEDLLETMDEPERAEGAEQLRELVQMVQRVAGQGSDARKAVTTGAVVGEHVDIHADQGSFAAGAATISGSVTLGATPPRPGT